MGRVGGRGARGRAGWLVVAAVVALAGLGIASGAHAGTVLVSRAPTGEVGNGYTDGPVISRDGRFVAFSSTATNLVTSPTPSGVQLYVRDRATGTNEMLSVSATGEVADDGVNMAAISGNGDVAVFNTRSTNLVSPDNGCDAGEDRHGNPRQCFRIFARDRVANTTTDVSQSWNGEPTDATSGDVDLSADGRYAVFSSFATNLVPDDTNHQGDVFLRDLQAGTTTRVSVASDGTQGNGQSYEPVVSADGRFVAFSSGADNLAAGGESDGTVYVVDRVLGSITAHGVDGVHAGGSFGPGISDDGSRLTYVSYSTLVPEDTNPSYDSYTEDVATGAKSLLAIDESGALVPGSDRAAVSGDGAYVTFRALALRAQDNAVNHVYRRRVADGALDLVTETDDGREVMTGSSPGPRSLSSDGRFVAYSAPDPTVVANDTNHDYDVFVRDFGAPAEHTAGTSGADTDTEADGATYLDPVETAVTGPVGSSVSIDEVDATQGLPAGFVALGQQANVHVTPGGTVGDPIALTFRFDASLLPPASGASAVHLFRNGVEVPDCTGAPSAVPDPCVSDRSLAVDGDVIVTARSSAASAWNGAIVPPQDTTAPQISVTSPSEGATYLQGSALTAQYTCSDDFGPADLTCTGDAANGDALDTTAVGPRTFHVHASDAAGNVADTTVAYTVVTDDTIAIGHSTVVEGDSTGARSLTFSVTLSRPADHAVTVHYATAPGSADAGSDFTARSATLKFAPSARTGLTPTTKLVTVPIRGDVAAEEDEYLTVGLANPTGGYRLGAGAGPAFGVIVDDDASTGLRVGVGDATVWEGDTATTNPGKVWVTLSAPVTGASVTVRLTPVPAGATNGVDHKTLMARTLTFRAGQYRKAISVAVLADTTVEGAEAVQLVLSQPSAGLAMVRATGTLTIADDD